MAVLERKENSELAHDRLARPSWRGYKHSRARLDVPTRLALVLIEGKPIAVGKGCKHWRGLLLTELRVRLSGTRRFEVGVGHDAAQVTAHRRPAFSRAIAQTNDGE